MSRFTHVFSKAPVDDSVGFAADFEFLLDTLPDAAFVMRPDGTLLAINAETARRLGRARPALLGKCIDEVMSPEVLTLFKKKIAELTETQRPVFYESRQGGRVIDSRLYPVLDAEGRIVRIVVFGRDVTPQRTTEEALHASRMLFNQTLRLGRMGSWEWDVAADTMHWSEETYKLHGFDPADFTPGSIDHIHRSLPCYTPSDEVLVHGAFRRCADRGEPYDLEVPFTTQDGRKLWVRTGAEAIRDTSGKVIRVVGYITDITALRASEEALRKSEEKYHVLMNEAAEMLFLHDFEGRFLDVNRAAIQGTGYTREELLGLSVYDIDHEISTRHDHEQLLLGLKQGSRAFIQTTLCRKDGVSFPAEVRLGKISFDGQDYILALASDISERKLAEQRQRESELRLNTLLANLPGMAYRCANDPDWTMEFVSEGAEALTGYTYKELVGRNGVRYASLIHPVDRRYVWTSIQAALEQDRAFTLEYRIHTRDGEEKWVWEKGRCAGDMLVEGFVTDISERKRYEQTLAEKTALENQLHHLQKADSLSRMAGAVAHHFNNKLSGVLASLELVRMQSVTKGVGAETIDVAIEAATQAADISKLMLTCLGHSRLDRRHIDLPELCRELRPSLASSMPETVLLDLFLPDESLVVWADAEALRQIVGHLVANAWEAEGTTRVGLRVARMHPGSFGKGVRYPVDWMPSDGAFVVIEVTDDGAGMSATMVEQIFDPFFTTKFTGRGIGLPLVLGLARSHGGGVIVDSKAGEGTVFRVCLPAAGDVAVASTRAEAKRPADGPGAVTVLLVEDEAPLRELAGMMIQSLGGRVISATNGKEALQQFDQHRAEIDLVFCDIRMPGIDGWQVLAKLRKADPTLPFVFATAYDDAAIAPDGYLGHPDALLRKPYLLKDVQGVLERFTK